MELANWNLKYFCHVKGWNSKKKGIVNQSHAKMSRYFLLGVDVTCKDCAVP